MATTPTTTEDFAQPKGSAQMSEIIAAAGTLNFLAAAALDSHQVGENHYVILPSGCKREDITDAVEKAQATPNRKRGQVRMKDLDSLLAYCKDQAASGTAYLYADPDMRTITAIFNDQRELLNAGWRDHRAEFKAEFTPEFSKWIAKDKLQISQGDFAEFIEDNFADITEPAAHVMLEMATTIQAKTDINFSSAKRLQNGQVQLQYTETIDARAGANGALEIPKEFALGLRIFKNGEGYKLKARLKYRLHSGTVKFWYELDRPERAVEDAFGGYVETLREQSGYCVLLGTP